MKDPKQGSPFSEGRGRGFDIPERKELPATNAARTVPIKIDLGTLNQPGKGPVNFEPARGREFNVPTQSGDKDGDTDAS